MHVFDTRTATPSAAYIRLEDTVQPYVPFGDPNNGGVTGPKWATILDWLTLAKREVEHEMRRRWPAECSVLPGGEHNWTLVESGCERVWPNVDITEGDDDEGRADGAGRVSVVAHSVDEEGASDGENYYLQCRSCLAERNLDDLDFV